MKRIIAAVVLIVFISVTAVIGRMTVSRSTHDVGELLSAAYDNALSGNFEEAAYYAARAEEKFVESEGMVSIFVDSSLVDDFGVAVGKLPPLASEDNRAEFLSHCSAARIMLIHLADGDRPILTNIL